MRHPKMHNSSHDTSTVATRYFSTGVQTDDESTVARRDRRSSPHYRRPSATDAPPLKAHKRPRRIEQLPLQHDRNQAFFVLTTKSYFGPFPTAEAALDAAERIRVQRHVKHVRIIDLARAGTEQPVYCHGVMR